MDSCWTAILQHTSHTHKNLELQAWFWLSYIDWYLFQYANVSTFFCFHFMCQRWWGRVSLSLTTSKSCTDVFTAISKMGSLFSNAYTLLHTVFAIFIHSNAIGNYDWSIAQSVCFFSKIFTKNSKNSIVLSSKKKIRPFPFGCALLINWFVCANLPPSFECLQDVKSSSLFCFTWFLFSFRCCCRCHILCKFSAGYVILWNYSTYLSIDSNRMRNKRFHWTMRNHHWCKQKHLHQWNWCTRCMNVMLAMGIVSIVAYDSKMYGNAMNWCHCKWLVCKYANGKI